MTRQELFEYGKSIGIEPSTWGERCVMVDTILAMQPKFCGECQFDYCGCSVQDSILKVEPDAKFNKFGCTHFKPNLCK